MQFKILVMLNIYVLCWLGIPKLSAHEVGDEVNMCPVILHPTKQLSSQVSYNYELF